MDTELFRAFREVARLGSFTAAAAALGFTQSAVSRQIAALEAEFGVPLFDRLARGVRLTEPGRSLLPHAEALVGRLTLAAEDLAALRSLAAGRLRVGAFPTANTTLMPHAVAAFRSAYPAVQFSLAEGFVVDLVARVAGGDLDLAVVTAAASAAAADIEVRHVLDDPMYVAMHPSHRCAGQRVVRLSELAGDDWIAGSDQLSRTLFSGSQFEPRITYVVREWVAKQGFVAAGLGVTLIPSLATGSVRPDVVLVPLHPDDSPVREICAVTPAGVTPPAALAPFLALLAEAAARVAKGVAVTSTPT
jgi:DNA-binding transcriptional LysR family regulator